MSAPSAAPEPAGRSDAIALLDASGSVEEWSDAAAELSGIVAAQAVGRPLWDCLGAPELEAARGWVEPVRFTDRAASPPRELCAHFQWLGAAGASRALVRMEPQVSLRVLESSPGLSPSEFARALGTLPDLLFLVDAEGNLASAGGAASPSSADWIADLLPELGQGVRSAIGRVLETGAVEVLQLRQAEGEGERHLEGRLARLEPRRAVLLVRDVTDRVSAEARVRESEGRLARLVDVSQDGYWELDFASGAGTLSREYRQLFGFPESGRLELSEVLGVIDNALEQNSLKELLGRLSSGESDRLHVNLVLRTTQGEAFPVLLRGGVMERDAQGKPVRAVGSIIDQRERQGLFDELLRSRDQYRSLFDQVPAMIATAGPEGEFDHFNQTWLDFTGLTLGESLSSGWLGVVHVEDAMRFQTAWCAAVLQGVVFQESFRIRRHDGAWRWVRNVARPFLGADGRPKGLVSVAFDVTERKEAEDSLAASLSALQATLESTADAILVADLAGRITHRNQRLLDLCRVEGPPADAAQALGSVAAQLKAPERMLALVKSAASKPAEPFGESLELRDGRVFDLRAFPQHQEGTLVGRVWSFRETTERSQADDARRRLASVLEATPDCVAITDPEGRTLFLNRAGRRMIGLGEEERVFPVRIADYCAGWAAELVMHEALPTAAREGVWAGESALLSREGQVIPVSQVVIAHRAQDGTLSHFSTVIRDITERKRIEAQLRTAKEQAEVANQAKSGFLAKMSHEIRTPMNGILGLCELALDTALDEQQRDYLAGIQQSASNLLHLINDILDFSKAEAGKIELETVEFGLRDAVASTLRLLAPQASRKGLELSHQVGEQVPDGLQGDPARLRQVLINLVGNAIKFTERGRVQVEVGQVDGPPGWVDLHFTVADTGVGIAPQALGRIFQAFSQGEVSTSRRYGGTGLGLAICKQLVELMGGRMWVDSKLGQGSRFHFLVRLALQQPKRAAASPSASLKGKRALVVDDNETTRSLLTSQLSSLGLSVEAADGTVAAVHALLQAKAERRGLDVVLVDVEMPDLDGWELATVVRADPIWEGAQLILLSGIGARPPKPEQVRSLRVAALLTRPLGTEELAAALARAFTPGAEPSPANGYEKGEGKPLTQQRSLKVLVAEDVELNQKIAKRLLEKHGHRVTIAGDGKEAVALFEREEFDFIFMDVQMPVMDGLEATRAIRELEKVRGGHVPIAAMTAFAQKEDADRCLREGMDGYLSKPVSGAAIVKALGQLADRLHKVG